MDETRVDEDLIREEIAAAKAAADKTRSCCGQGIELVRFDKAVYDCRERFRKLVGGKGSITLTVSFEGGRITHVQKEFSEE